MVTVHHSGLFICRRCCGALRTQATTSTRIRSPLVSSIRSRRQISTAALASATFTVNERIEHLGGLQRLPACFPRVSEHGNQNDKLSTAISEAEKLELGAIDKTRVFKVHGRLTSIRDSGKKLAFLDIFDGQTAGQIVVSGDGVGELVQRARRGDWISVSGYPHLTKRGQPSVRAADIPTIISPSLQTVPLEIKDAEFLMRNRHVNQIVHSDAADIIRLRSIVIQALRNFFLKDDFVEVSTPLLVAGAGGAIARPFETVATEFSDTTLNLRVAPELFLKRLIVGNIEKVFEIGPAFRNEGVDATHNPEFTICEFYERMASLESLISKTENLFHALQTAVSTSPVRSAINPPTISTSFKRIEFIPAIEQAIRNEIPAWIFPSLTDTETARTELLKVLSQLHISPSDHPTLPRLLDALSAHYLEPQCSDPTFITHHPEVLSPLAKSFTYIAPDGTQHAVAARAELFIQGREYVNCYEEENSPVEQRRKFELQAALRNVSPLNRSEEATDVSRTDDGSTGGEIHGADDETGATIDESYLSALEWGMPPTGGWGCGVDRLVMLFTGKTRIADVLPFGTLRNVVALGSNKNKRRR